MKIGEHAAFEALHVLGGAPPMLDRVLELSFRGPSHSPPLVLRHSRQFLGDLLISCIREDKFNDIVTGLGRGTYLQLA